MGFITTISSVRSQEEFLYLSKGVLIKGDIIVVCA